MLGWGSVMLRRCHCSHQITIKKKDMKKLICVSILAICVGLFTASKCEAQSGYSYEKKSTDTSVTSSSLDTTVVEVVDIPSNIMSITAKVKKLSGTFPTGTHAISGVYSLLQFTNEGSDWQDVNTDTLKCANKSINTKTWTLTQTSYNSYRIVTRYPSSTQTSLTSIIYVRRPDERRQ